MQALTFYSDSMDVLWWMRARGRSFRPFLPIRWVDTDGERSITMVTRGDRRNPADLCTRGAIPGELLVA